MGFVKFRGILSSWKGRLAAPVAVPWQDHWVVRTAAVSAQLRWLGAGSLMLVGDSLFELVPPHPLEGMKVVNAGFGGAKASDVYGSISSSLVWSALKANPPAKAFVQVGTNDSKIGANPAAISESTLAICTLFRRVGTEVTVFAIPPIEERKTAFRSASMATAINEATRSRAANAGISFIDPYKSLRETEGVTEDGIHLARHGIDALVTAIKRAA